MITFTIYGEPVAQGRPRTGKSFTGKTVVYDPKKSRNYKQYVRLVALEHRPKNLLESELELVIDVFRKIPKSMPKYKQELAIEGKLRPTTKPDVDNYAKGIKDGLSGIIWNDDKQVVSLLVRKWYSSTPRVEVKVIEIEEEGTCQNKLLI
ncbi:RusA family crossover junction endodeoxyribonuclease [Evansella tamaricis]|uniref:RusA family crossover junction endodeoxyribonuclease n=1 Tax=Evansella tamaricis TaxID=2069301 RepID=A0ABS6JBN5_9BACI|nr:RusA family crossover junction endodeoxyribonuclease [Evansella tamaricis]MBU9711088.1 RusA family crossover junction endodeoxyribonuclease [Evansella tamaricis]